MVTGLAFTNDPNDPNVTNAVLNTAFKVNSGTIAGTFGTLLPLLRMESERQINVVRALLHSVKSGEIGVKLSALQILYEYLRFRGRQDRSITRSVEKYYELIRTLHEDWYRNPDSMRARISALSGLVLLHVACSSQLHHISPPPPRLFDTVDLVHLLNTAQTTEELCFASATLGILVEFHNLPEKMAEANVFPIMKHKLVHLLPAFLNHDFSSSDQQYQHELSLTSTLANMFLAFSLLLKYAPFYQGRFAVVNDIRFMNLLSMAIVKFDKQNLYGQQLFRVAAFAIVGNCAIESALRSTINKKYNLYPTVIKQYFYAPDPSTSMFQGGSLLNILETPDCPVLNDTSLALHVLKQITKNEQASAQYMDNAVNLIDAMVRYGTKGPVIGAFMGKIGFIHMLIHNHIANGVGETKLRATSIVNRCLKNSKVIAASGVGPSEVNVLLAYQMCAGRLLCQLFPNLLPLEYETLDDLPEYRCTWPCCHGDSPVDLISEPTAKSHGTYTINVVPPRTATGTTESSYATSAASSDTEHSSSSTITRASSRNFLTNTGTTSRHGIIRNSSALLSEQVTSPWSPEAHGLTTDVTATTSGYYDDSSSSSSETNATSSTYKTATTYEPTSESVFLTTAIPAYAPSAYEQQYMLQNMPGPSTYRTTTNTPAMYNTTERSFYPNQQWPDASSETTSSSSSGGRSSQSSSSSGYYSSSSGTSSSSRTETLSEKVRSSYGISSQTRTTNQPPTHLSHPFTQSTYMPSYLVDSMKLQGSPLSSFNSRSSSSTSSSSGSSSMSSSRDSILSTSTSSSSSSGSTTSSSSVSSTSASKAYSRYYNTGSTYAPQSHMYSYAPTSHLPSSYQVYE